MELWIGVAALLGLALGFALAWLLRGPATRERDAALHERDAAQEEAGRWRGEDDRHRVRLAEAVVEIKGLQERVAGLSTAEAARGALATELAALQATLVERDASHVAELKRAAETFEALAGKALEGAQAKLGEQAELLLTRHRELAEAGLGEKHAKLSELIAPMRETLGKYEARLGEVEAARNEAYGGLREQVAQLALGQQRVTDETARLGTALRTSGKSAGSWGEQQLRNTLEMAGLRLNIDFVLQASTTGEDGSKRPDAIIRLPGGRSMIIDSKCSLGDYLAAGEAEGDEARRAAYRRHAACVRAHVKGLADKAYWKEHAQSADFVILFLAGENFLSAALEHDLPLLGWAFEQRVLLAGPINLLAIAKTVALVWRQEKLAQEAKEIGKLGAELHASIAVMAEHVAGMGRNLGQAVNGYNAMLGSLERNVLPKARRFTELGVDPGKKPVALLALVEAVPGAPNSPELRLAAPASEAAE